MARENQGFQIALIIFVILSLLLGVATYLFFRQYTEAAQQAQQSIEREQQTSQSLNALQRDFNTLKELAGFDPTTEITAISEDAQRDLEIYGADLEAENRSYRTVVTHLWQTLQEKNATLAQTQQQLRDAQTTIAQLEASKAPLIKAQEQRADQAEAQLAQRTNQFTQDLNEANQANQELLAQVEKTRTETEEKLAAMQAQLQQAGIKMQTLSNLLSARTETIQKMKNPEFETADGNIQWVDQRLGLVWINLGEADGLTQQTVFSVYPSNTYDVTAAKPKGSVEVIRIHGPRLSEARIVEDVISDPILPGDKVDTLIWDPGDRRRFALMNFVDMDGDGKSDQQELINIIRTSGGVVDAYIDDQGNRHGEVTADTDLLVIGDEPPDDTPADVINARSQFLGEAEDMAVQKISVRDLLRRIGYTRRAYVTRYGSGADASDFRARPEGGAPRASTGSVSPLFQERKPPRAGRNGAF